MRLFETRIFKTGLPRRRLPIPGLLVLLLLLGTVAPGTTVAELLGSKELHACHLPNDRREVLCGTHTVFEDRAAAAGRQITIHFAILPAVGEEPLADPVVFFAGGPGQAATEMAPLVRQAFSQVGEQRDIVLIDQRGMGASHPLACDAAQTVAEEGLILPPQEILARTQEALRGCLAEWDADVSLYTQDLANEDVHEILGALGYTRVNLFGGSWGTRSALLYAHRYPEQVRSVVLDGALPPSNAAPTHAAVDGDRALRALLDDCAADADCQTAFPVLEDDFQQAKRRLDDGLEMTVYDPLTGEPIDVLLTAEGFGALLRNILYSPDLSRVLPWVIHRAAAGDFRPLLGVSSFFATASGDAMTLGASLAIFCAEELARAEPAPDGSETDGSETDGDGGDSQTATETAEAGLLGEALLASLRSACTIWPETTVPSLYGEAIGSSAPTLVLSGALDPITPPRWGEAMVELLPNGRHLVSPNTGHNVAPVGCAPDLIAQFIDQADASGLDASCLDTVTRPSFFIDASGPAMTVPGGGA